MMENRNEIAFDNFNVVYKDKVEYYNDYRCAAAQLILQNLFRRDNMELLYFKVFTGKGMDLFEENVSRAISSPKFSEHLSCLKDRVDDW